MRFVDRESGKEVALTHAIYKTSLSIVPLDVVFSGIALVRVKGHRAGSTILVTTVSHVVIYGKGSVIIWKQPLRSLALESHGLDLVRLTGPNESLEIGTGLSRRKELIDHLILAQKYSENAETVLDDARGYDKEIIRAEQKEIKLAEREAKAQQRSSDQKVRKEQRSSDQKARKEQKIAQAKRELESYGRKVFEESCAGKRVRIYEKGYVRVSGKFLKDGAVFEKLIAIESSADVAKKTALGRTLMFGATMGLNVLTTPNNRGDMYLTIATDRTTHMLHMSPPRERDLKAMHKIATAGQGILDSLERQLRVENSRNASIATVSSQSVAPQVSIIDELTKLVALRDAGAISEDEFSAMKSQLMGGSRGIADGSAPEDIPETPAAQEYFDVVLLDGRPQLIVTIKVVRKFTNLGLAEAKKKVDSAPAIVGTSLSHDDALRFVEELRSVGATAEMR